MLRVHDVCSVLFFLSRCLCICGCECLKIQGSLRECCLIQLGASGLPYYCAPFVCVPAVIALLAVWLHNTLNLKPKNLHVITQITAHHAYAFLMYSGDLRRDGYNKQTNLQTTTMHSRLTRDVLVEGVVIINNNQKQNYLDQSIHIVLSYTHWPLQINIRVSKPQVHWGSAFGPGASGHPVTAHHLYAFLIRWRMEYLHCGWTRV